MGQNNFYPGSTVYRDGGKTQTPRDAYRTWDIMETGTFTKNDPAMQSRAQVLNRKVFTLPDYSKTVWRIGSPYMHTEWIPHTLFVAEGFSLDAGHAQNGSGIHAWCTPNGLKHYHSDDRTKVSGKVYLAGKVPCSCHPQGWHWARVKTHLLAYGIQGYLGEAGYPACFFIHPKMKEEAKRRIRFVSNAYAVPLEPWPSDDLAEGDD